MLSGARSLFGMSATELPAGSLAGHEVSPIHEDDSPGTEMAKQSFGFEREAVDASGSGEAVDASGSGGADVAATVVDPHRLHVAANAAAWEQWKRLEDAGLSEADIEAIQADPTNIASLLETVQCVVILGSYKFFYEEDELGGWPDGLRF